MKAAKTASVEELQITGQFESVRQVLLGPEYDKHLDKPLAYWRCRSTDGCRWRFSAARCATC